MSWIVRHYASANGWLWRWREWLAVGWPVALARMAG